MNDKKLKQIMTHLINRLTHFCEQEQLPRHFYGLAESYYLPLAHDLTKRVEQRDKSSSPLLIGINGCQGSGKTTLTTLLTELLTHCYHKNVASLSIDDFYLTQKDRQELARKVHPLFATRGVPGTHDINLLTETLDQLNSKQTRIAIPRFNKANDDRHPPEQWDSIVPPVDIILLEGWCIGVSPQTESALESPVNTLEETEDPDGKWRHTVNHFIEELYMPLFKRLDYLVMLQAPSFDCVYHWREEQEEKLRQSVTSLNTENQHIMNTEQIKRFIEHYQRLTEHMLQTLPANADTVFTLNTHHHITERINHANT